MSTIYHDFVAAAARYPQRTAIEVIRRDTVESLTYETLARQVDRAAALWCRLGLRDGDRCAILANNDAQWCAAYLGAQRLGAAVVPLDTAYHADQVGTILADSGARIVVTSETYLATVREAVALVPQPPAIALLHGPLDGLPALGTADDPTPASLPPVATRPEAPSVLLYTSGTTSDPKGVMLSHAAFLAERDAAYQVFEVLYSDSILGILPLFHALAQLTNLVMPLTSGTRIVFLETVSGEELIRVLSTGGITVFCVVPQFFYLIHQRIMTRLESGPWLIRRLARALMRVNGTLRERWRINLGRLFFRSVHRTVGPHIRVFVTGGSRFDPVVGRAMYDMGFNILQAYGLTECAGACASNRQGDARVDSVGQALPGVEIRILESPSTAGTRDHEDGEVLVRGPILMDGYYNRPDATAAALRDGWLYTGDLGYLDAEGRLYITGRKKDVIVLASGKNIYPEEIEAAYLQSPLVKELCVLGITHPDEPSSERLHAIIVPATDILAERRVVNMREAIRFEIEGLSLHLPPHKRVLSFDVWQEDLPRTTTRKLKRAQIAREFEARRSDRDTSALVPVTDEDARWLADPFVVPLIAEIRTLAKTGARLRPGASLELDLGLDSMERVELITALERAAGTTLAAEATQQILTLGDLVEALRHRAAVDAAPRPDIGEDSWRVMLAPGAAHADWSTLLRRRWCYPWMAYALIRTWRLFARFVWGLRPTGVHHLDNPGPFLICPNHQSFLDAFLLVSALPYQTFARLFFVGAAEYFDSPWRRTLAHLMNVIPVNADAQLVNAMQAAAFGLRHGRVLVLFPEGERSPDGTVRTLKKGAAILARNVGVPIVPAAIHGVYELWPRGGRFRWSSVLPWSAGHARLAFEPPIDAASTEVPAGADPDTALTERLGQAIRTRWHALDHDAQR